MLVRLTRTPRQPAGVKMEACPLGPLRWQPAQGPTFQSHWGGDPPGVAGPHFSHARIAYTVLQHTAEVRHLCLIRPFQQRLSFFSNGARAAPTETGGLKDEEDPPVQSWGQEQTPWLCRLLLEPGCTWIQPWSQAGLLLCVWELTHAHTHRWPDGHQQLQRKQNKLPKQIKTLHLPKQMRFSNWIYQLQLNLL